MTGIQDQISPLLFTLGEWREGTRQFYAKDEKGMYRKRPALFFVVLFGPRFLLVSSTASKGRKSMAEKR